MNSTDAAFGRLLRRVREAQDLSQTGLARRLGWPQATVSRVEQGRRGVTLSELLSVSRVFKRPVSELLGELLKGEAVPAEPPEFSPGLYAAMQSEDSAAAQLARYGVRFFGEQPGPALVALPFEETVLAALRFSGDPRVFEALPALLLKHAVSCDWTKLTAGAYALRLQNRLGMAVAAALQLKAASRGFDAKAWAALSAAHETLAQGRLDREEVVGPVPKTAGGRALLEKRTPGWMRFWHGLSAVDMKAFERHL